MAEQVITTQLAEKNKYGDLIITDTLGKEHKVASKRSHLFDKFVEGRATKLTIKNFQGHDYIDDAELFDGQSPLTETTTQVPPQPSPEATKSPTSPVSDKDRQIARAVALKAAVDLCSNGKIELDKVGVWTGKFEKYLVEGGMGKLAQEAVKMGAEPE